MKYIVVLGDGMADEPLAELDNKTPLAYAKKPNMDYLAKKGTVGMVKTVPENMLPASDVANLSVIGYNPREYYTGRSPLEAVSMGVSMSSTDVALRCNLVTLSEEATYSEKTMLDYSAGEITTEEAEELIEAVRAELETELCKYYAGVSYRHCMIWDNGEVEQKLTPPHDITDKKINDYLPKNKMILEMMEKSYEILKNHSVNKRRKEEGYSPANSIWLWGEGTKPELSDFETKYGKKGSMISAVDLLKGIGICVGLDSIDVEGATANIHTNFLGKKDAAIQELRNGKDFVYLHIEAPDECGHKGEVENKILSIELIDKKVVGPLIEELKEFGEYSILVLPDHPTPLHLKTHTPNPVPFILYNSIAEKDSGVLLYSEEEAEKTGVYIEEGHTLMGIFLK